MHQIFCALLIAARPSAVSGQVFRLHFYDVIVTCSSTTSAPYASLRCDAAPWPFSDAGITGNMSVAKFCGCGRGLIFVHTRFVYSISVRCWSYSF